jgi:uncharacterized protein
MTIPPDASLLRIFVNSNDRYQGKALYQAIVEMARADGMAGVSVFPVLVGVGTHHRLHDSSSDYEFAEMPVVVELVDGPDRASAFLAKIGTILVEGLATVQSVRVIRYAH